MKSFDTLIVYFDVLSSVCKDQKASNDLETLFRSDEFENPTRIHPEDLS